MADSTDFSDFILDNSLYELFCTPPTNLAPVAFEELFIPLNIPESLSTSALLDLERLYGHILETPWDAPSTQGNPGKPSPNDTPDASSFPPQIVTPVDYGLSLCQICSASLSPPPPSQTVTPPPLPTLPTPPTLPTSPTLPPPNWRMVPQTAYGRGRRQWDFIPSEPISFGVNGRPGVNMGDIFRKRFGDLDGRDDLMFQDARSAFSCRFLFPGYPPNESQQKISTRYWNKERDPITRSWLAYLIARKLGEYLSSMAPRPYTVTESTPGWLQIGEGFMHLDNMFLVRLESVTKGSWQPVIYVVDPAFA